jgi:hypothetical protein
MDWRRVVIGEKPCAAFQLMPRAPAGVLRSKAPCIHANLSGMLPERPRALNFDLAASSAAEISQSGAAGSTSEATPAEHHCQICPTCSHRLTSHRCKLVCTHCGYYLSCADYC